MNLGIKYFSINTYINFYMNVLGYLTRFFRWHNSNILWYNINLIYILRIKFTFKGDPELFYCLKINY